MIIRILSAILLITLSSGLTFYFVRSNPDVIQLDQLPDGGIYQGEKDDRGLLSGAGRLEWKNGSYYQGEFAQGMFNGQGKGFQKGSGEYFGQFKNGLLEGKGELIFQDGTVYKGDFHQGVMQGNGRIEYSDGSIYEGDFLDGKLEGEGKFIFRDGTRYEGQVNNGLMHGQGKFTYVHGGVYQGEFVNNEMTGMGEYKDRAMHYVGSFSEGRFFGKGKLINIQSGETIEAVFDDGVAEGEGIKTDKKGNRWEGHFEYGELSGKGKYQGVNGETYEGNFRYGRYDGEGLLVEKNGNIYRGKFSYGNKQGAGELTLAKPVNGQTIAKGFWSHGKLDQASGALTIHAADEISEFAMYGQHEVLRGRLESIDKNNPDLRELYSLVVAGYGSQEVFNRELNYVKNFLNKEFSSPNKFVFLSNTRYQLNQPLATLQNIEASILSLADHMNKDQDILFIYLTSHGSKEGEFSLEHKGMQLKSMPADWFADLLKKSGIKNKVIVVSACYSGKFIEPLKDDNSLILTSAAADRRSFGCSDERHFTYFGKAYFDNALQNNRDFEKAFADAKTLISKWEKKQKEKPSNPQIYVGPQIRAVLDDWNWGKLNNQARDSL